MIAMAKDMQQAMKRHEELDLNPNEEAFYDALADRPEVLLSMGGILSDSAPSPQPPPFNCVPRVTTGLS